MVLSIAAITARMSVTTRIMVIRTHSLLEDKKYLNEKGKKKKRRELSRESSSSDSEHTSRSEDSIEEDASTT